MKGEFSIMKTLYNKFNFKLKETIIRFSTAMFNKFGRPGLVAVLAVMLLIAAVFFYGVGALALMPFSGAHFSFNLIEISLTIVIGFLVTHLISLIGKIIR